MLWRINTQTRKKDFTILYILTIWVVYLIVLGILQIIGIESGYSVWPLGEDRNWIGFMMYSPGKAMLNEFWKLDSRNPLSAWLWYLISPLILQFDSALYLIRKCLDPILAIIIYLLFNQTFKNKFKLYSFTVAFTVLMWNYSAYYEQITWVFLFALSFTLLSILFYLKYVDNNRSQAEYLAFSLIFYFVAIATYTLQSGAILAVAGIALFRDKSSIAIKFKQAVIDSSIFAAIFIIYNCIWYTADINAGAHYNLNFKLFLTQFPLSIKLLFYHNAFNQFWYFVTYDLSTNIIIGCLILFFAFSYVVFRRYTFLYPENIKIGGQIGWVIIFLLAIAFPTIIVESTSEIWYPGSRSLMLQQIFQPLLYISIIWFAIDLLAVSGSKKQLISTAITALLCAFVILVNFDYNHHLVKRTKAQKILAEGIKKIRKESNAFQYYIVNFTNRHFDYYAIPFANSRYANTMIKDKGFSLRVIPNAPYPVFGSKWRIKFAEDNIGVKNAGVLTENKIIPYSQVWIVNFDGEKVTIPTIVRKEDFIGLQVDWERSNPLIQTKFHL